MFVELSQNLILVAVGAFLLGWLLSSISSSLGSRYKAKKRDARDDRIRSLEADLRVAKTDADRSQENIEKLEEELKDTHVGIERRDNVITEQQLKIDRVSRDLKESVIKTRELRAELAERATENVHAEARIREVQTELSVAQASQDMLATGILDYDTEDADEEPEVDREPEKTSGAAT